VSQSDIAEMKRRAAYTEVAPRRIGTGGPVIAAAEDRPLDEVGVREHQVDRYLVLRRVLRPAALSVPRMPRVQELRGRPVADERLQLLSRERLPQ
jgi:hypothetical protein